MSTEPDFGHVPFDALWKELFAYSQKTKTQHNVTTKLLREEVACHRPHHHRHHPMIIGIIISIIIASHCSFCE
jgi:hypothetical protein